jgi:pyruvate dehydrogenase E2 component (dihydrolipoamide acetyltransferase)
MAFSVVMPALEMAQETGKLVSWRKQEGEAVVKGEPLLEIETDKAVMEIEAPADGVLAGIKVRAGAVVPVGQTIAWIVLPGEALPPDRPMALCAKPAMGPLAPAAPPDVKPAEHPAESGPRVSPKARRLAKEHGVDLSRLRGSGPEGEILASDILAAAEPSKAAVGESDSASETLSSVARLMAERTTQSWTSVPHFFATREMDAAAMVIARDNLEEAVERARGVKLTYTDVLVAVCARTLTKHPRLNASWTGQGIRLNPQVNVAIAVAVEDGVVAAVIADAASAALSEIAAQRRILTERARAGRLRPSDIAGATFTISNLGMHQVDSFSAILSPPQAATLAVGRIRERVVPVDGRPGIRPMMTVTLSADHRVVDGARAAAFLNDLAAAIAVAGKLLL